MRFRPDRPPHRTPWSLLVLLLVVGGALTLRASPVADRPPVLVEVVGDVLRPGLYGLQEPTVHALLARAGGPAVPDQPIPDGFRVRVTGQQVQFEPPPDPLIVGLPVDPNTASVDALRAIPGIGRTTAERILAERQERPFRDIGDLRRVKGVSSERLAELRPFLTLAPLDPIDINAATEAELDRLPGVGPALASRIVEHRHRRGAFAVPDDLLQVSGIGPATLDALRPLLVFP